MTDTTLATPNNSAAGKEIIDQVPMPASPAQAPDTMALMIERIILNPNVDVDKLERLLVMKERMDLNAAKAEFADALSAACAEIPPIIKNATVDFTSQNAKGRVHYKHETQAGIAKTIDKILSRHGLSYRFRTNEENGRLIVTCILSHRNGYCEENSLSGLPDRSGSKNDLQAVGSTVTYLQRYTLKAGLGLSSEVDDDGASAGAAPITSEQFQILKNKIESAGADEAKLLKHLKADDLHTLTNAQFQLAIAQLEIKIARAQS